MIGRLYLPCTAFAIVMLAACDGFAQSVPGRPDRDSIEAEISPGGNRDTIASEMQGKPGEKDDESEEPKGLFGKRFHGQGGLSLEYVYTGDIFNNARGGISTKNATTYRGNFDLTIKADLEKMGFAPGGNFFLYGENGHGVGPTRYVGDFQVASNIDAPDFTQVSEYWYDRNFFDKFLTVRLGKQDCNVEFAVVDLGGDFMNSSFQLPPTIPMPTFPYNSMGALTFFHIGERTSLKVGVWDGMPEIGNWGFSGSGIAFSIGEFKTAYDLNWAEKVLPGDFHVGMWYHSGDWKSVAGEGLDSVSSSGGDLAAQRTRYSFFGPYSLAGRPGKETAYDGKIFHGNHGVHMGLEQLILKEKDEEKDKQGLGVFAQYGWAPGDRNWATQYLGGGLVYRGLLPSRDEDLLGAGVAHVIFSDELPGTGQETAIELYYKAQVARWASLQPDLQYIVSPGGRQRDASLVGLRFEAAF